MDETLMDLNALCSLLHVSRRTIWRWVATGLLPRPFAIGRRIRRWRRSDIESLLVRAQARQAESAVTA